MNKYRYTCANVRELIKRIDASCVADCAYFCDCLDVMLRSKQDSDDGVEILRHACYQLANGAGKRVVDLEHFQALFGSLNTPVKCACRKTEGAVEVIRSWRLAFINTEAPCFKRQL